MKMKPAAEWLRGVLSAVDGCDVLLVASGAVMLWGIADISTAAAKIIGGMLGAFVAIQWSRRST